MKGCKLVDVPIGTRKTVRCLGGNIHNEDLSYDDDVTLYKAVCGRNGGLSNIGDYVAYQVDNEVGYIMTMYTCC